MTPTLSHLQAKAAVYAALRREDLSTAQKFAVVQDGAPEAVEWDGVEAIYWHFTLHLNGRVVGAANVPDHYSAGTDLDWSRA